MAAIAALACCKQSIDGLCGVLEYWRGLFKHWLPKGVVLHFDGNFGDPLWDDFLLKLREDPSNLLHETESRRDAFAWIERAEAWLAHGVHIEGVGRKIETAAQYATNKAREQAMKEAGESARKRRSEAAKKSARNKKQAKESRKAIVKKAWLSLQSTQQGRGGVGIVAKRVSLSDRTVRRYLKELGYLDK